MTLLCDGHTAPMEPFTASPAQAIAETRPRSGRRRFIGFEGLAGPIETIDCPEVEIALRQVARGWPFEVLRRDLRPPVARLYRGAGGYVLEAPALDAVFDAPSLAGILSTLLVEIGEARLRAGSETLVLHAAAAVLGRGEERGLVLFPAASRAGKSSLTASFAALGEQVFSDDLVAIDTVAEGSSAPSRGRSLGFAPRLRLPLPPSAPEALRRLLRERPSRDLGLSDGYYHFLDLPPAQAPRFGASAPLRAVVLLDRRADGPARLTRVPLGQGLPQLISQSLLMEDAPQRTLDQLDRALDGLACFRLVYADLAEATALLRRAFNEGPLPSEEEPLPPARSEASARHPEELRDRPLVQASGLTLRRIRGESFLCRESSDLYHLNTLAGIVWARLETPASPRVIAREFQAAFPDEPRTRIQRDLARLLAEFEARGLAVAAPLAAAQHEVA